MARAVICLSVFAGMLALAAPASAHQQNSGFMAVTKLQIDPNMDMLSDGPDPKQAAQQKNSAPEQKDAGQPLDQLGADQADADAPAGDDPYSDNAVEADTVYTA
jgi:hypothetical protein